MLSVTRSPAIASDGSPPLVIVHGLFGSGRNWGAIARHLAGPRDVIVPDLRNHGESPHLPSHDYADLAGDLIEVLLAEGRACDVLGHSMGGKAAMVLALTRGDLIRKLIVADIAPVAYEHDNLRHIAAMRGLDLSGRPSRAEADRRLAATVPDPALRAFFLQSLDLKADPPRWRLNLDVLEEFMPEIVGWPGVAGRFEGPALFLAGEESNYVLPEYRGAIRALFPKARVARLAGAGHWLHADRPREFEGVVGVFLG